MRTMDMMHLLPRVSIPKRNKKKEQPKDPYAELHEALILRDHLAAERTAMANERTLMAFGRTSITLLVAGVSGLNIFENNAMRFLSSSFVVLAVFVFIFGLSRFRQIQKKLRFMDAIEQRANRSKVHKGAKRGEGEA